MTRLKGIAGVGLIAASVFFGAAVVPSAVSQTPVERMTTDTPEFCAQLLRMLRETLRTHPAPREIFALSNEGQEMCDHGDARRGVLRLRQAMRYLLNAATASPGPSAPMPAPATAITPTQ